MAPAARPKPAARLGQPVKITFRVQRRDRRHARPGRGARPPPPGPEEAPLAVSRRGGVCGLAVRCRARPGRGAPSRQQAGMGAVHAYQPQIAHNRSSAMQCCRRATAGHDAVKAAHGAALASWRPQGRRLRPADDAPARDTAQYTSGGRPSRDVYAQPPLHVPAQATLRSVAAAAGRRGVERRRRWRPLERPAAHYPARGRLGAEHYDPVRRKPCGGPL